MHIADVSHYVQKGSAIDREALDRGTSVYLVDRTIPMLPEKLCNNVCSLRPDEEKLTFSVVFEMDDDAKIYDKWIGKTIIKSCRRYTYEEVQTMIEGGEGVACGILDAAVQVDGQHTLGACADAASTKGIAEAVVLNFVAQAAA